MDYGPSITGVKHSTWSKAIDIDPTSIPNMCEPVGQILDQPNACVQD
jgi:hypothetical protein